MPPLAGHRTTDLVQYGSRFASQDNAERYAERFERGLRKHIHQNEQRALGVVLSRLGRCDSVLDVPCGAGRFLVLLGRHSDLVIEADISAEMLACSERRHQETMGDCRFIQADATCLPFPDHSVDRIFCNRLLHHLRQPSERATVLQELHRVVRENVIVSFFDYRSFGTLRRCLKRVKGRKTRYREHPTRAQFVDEIIRRGFRVHFITPVGSLWNAQKYFVLARD
jgi:ubiquinone/menaquinone biosynthesis C-methylase UbiE